MKAKKAVPPCRTAPNRNEPALLFRLVDLAKLLEEFFELIGYILLLTEAYKTERIAEGKDTPLNA